MTAEPFGNVAGGKVVAGLVIGWCNAGGLCGPRAAARRAGRALAGRRIARAERGLERIPALRARRR